MSQPIEKLQDIEGIKRPLVKDQDEQQDISDYSQQLKQQKLEKNNSSKINVNKKKNDKNEYIQFEDQENESENNQNYLHIEQRNNTIQDNLEDKIKSIISQNIVPQLTEIRIENQDIVNSNNNEVQDNQNAQSASNDNNIQNNGDSNQNQDENQNLSEQKLEQITNTLRQYLIDTASMLFLRLLLIIFALCILFDQNSYCSQTPQQDRDVLLIFGYLLTDILVFILQQWIFQLAKKCKDQISIEKLQEPLYDKLYEVYLLNQSQGNSYRKTLSIYKIILDNSNNTILKAGYIIQTLIQWILFYFTLSRVILYSDEKWCSSYVFYYIITELLWGSIEIFMVLFIVIGIILASLILAPIMIGIHIYKRVKQARIEQLNKRLLESIPTKKYQDIKNDIQQEECSICLSNYESECDIIVLNCNQNNINHCFHSICLKEWLQKNMHCPICRTEVKLK